MNTSLFTKWLADSFQNVLTKAISLINGSKNAPTYLHKTMLRKEFSPTMKWGSITSNGGTVAADIVSLDSTLPIKKRESISKVTGDIPKMGMSLTLNERQMNDLILLEATEGMEKEIIKKLYDDPVKCVTGVDELNELLFLQALSSGVALRTDGDQPGLGLRIDYQHPNENKFGAVVPWSDISNATPIDDIKRVRKIARENGDSPRYILMDDNTWNRLKKNAQVKEAYAFSVGFVGSNIPEPSLDKFNAYLNGEFGMTIMIIDRTVNTEMNGKKTVVRPWTANAVTFLNDISNVGTLTWSTVAEMKFRVKQVTYAVVNDYVLVSKFSTTNPVKETSASQALCLPVLDNVSSIYILNSEEAATDSQTESDSAFDYEGTEYTLASVISAINTAYGETVASASNTDAELLVLINEMSDAQILVFEDNITETP